MADKKKYAFMKSIRTIPPKPMSPKPAKVEVKEKKDKLMKSGGRVKKGK